MNVDKFDSASRAKARHYQKFASELKKLSNNLEETRILFDRVEEDLQAMGTLAGLHGAQFMAFTAIEDRIHAEKDRKAQEDKA